ncbi:hypothetical protein M5X02_30715 [Paenibacillus alvei]|uniref:hypothetical protein n=1 Tax=Paenibacillus alvei TaxID=44250 RepID=UPI0002892F0F|nr:hypothetical protein [Paenibacillus alvei]EJW13952.1 hypothetical protein PAV_141p00580 [Paenibacillus alvei DSM 29]MCY9545000.1 hypothetical protein [Paenibacillus alvei]MCY9707685.1 hypothetical protein [Paenibacillus alvei]MEC0082802.1 hypothetical protein [Paenibacillus alvei]
MNRWLLTEEVKQKYTPIIQGFIDKLEAMNPDEQEDLLEINLSDTGLNPYTLQELLESLGYEKTDFDDNGWQMDFWITMEKNGCKSIVIEGTGIIFELKLRENE